IASGAKGTQIVGGKWFDIYVDPGAISVGIAHALLQHCIVDNSGGSANVRLQSNWVTGLPNWHDVGCISGFGNSGYDQIGNTLVHRRLIVKPPQTDPPTFYYAPSDDEPFHVVGKAQNNLSQRGMLHLWNVDNTQQQFFMGIDSSVGTNGRVYLGGANTGRPMPGIWGPASPAGLRIS